MSKRWYVKEAPASEPVGPFSIAELRAQVQACGDALVAIAGGIEWRPLLAELAVQDPVGVAPTAAHTPVASTPGAAGALPRTPRPASVPPPPVGQAGAAPRGRLSNVGLLVVSFVGLVVLAFLVFGAVFVARRSVGLKDFSQSVVRVVMQTASGTGFFVAGPDDLAYVATAYHVVASGEPILIEQTLVGSGGRRYPQAYPDAEVVAFDADADVAVIRLNGVTRDHFRPLPLAAAAAADETVLWYGFPGSNLAHRFGMVSKPGKVLSLVRFPVVDRRSGEIVRAATPSPACSSRSTSSLASAAGRRATIAARWSA